MLASPGCVINQVVHGDFSEGSGTEAARALLARGSLPQAVVCANDQMAIGVLREFQREGIAVPADVALTGFDDVYPPAGRPAADHGEPAAARARRPARPRRLLARIENRALPPRDRRAADPGHDPGQLRLPGEGHHTSGSGDTPVKPERSSAVRKHLDWLTGAGTGGAAA